MLSILLVGFPILNQITNSTILIAVTVVLNFYYSFAEKTFIRNMEAKNLNVIRIGRVTFNSIVIITSFYLFGGNNSRIIILFNILSILIVNVFIYFKYLKKYQLFGLISVTFIFKATKRFPKIYWSWNALQYISVSNTNFRGWFLFSSH